MRHTSVKPSKSTSTMIKIFVVCLLAASAYGFGYPSYGYNYAPEVHVVKVEKVVEVEDKPEPYEFSYSITDDESNTQARSESGDAYGNMKGSYSQKNAAGLERFVEYVADGEGFRAIVMTNEPGTDSQSPADVEMNASPVEVKEVPEKVIQKVVLVPTYEHRGYAPVYGYGRHHY